MLATSEQHLNHKHNGNIYIHILKHIVDPSLKRLDSIVFESIIIILHKINILYMLVNWGKGLYSNTSSFFTPLFTTSFSGEGSI